MEVEDLLRDPLIGVLGRYEQRKRDREAEEACSGESEDREVIP